MPVGGGNIEAIQERLSQLEAVIGVPQVDEPLCTRVDNLVAKASLLEESFGLVHQHMDEMAFNIKLIKAMLQNLSQGDGAVKMKVPDPKPFNGTQECQESGKFSMGHGTIFQGCTCP